MCTERTTVGLDVHARSVVAEAVDWASGRVFGQRLVPANDVVLGWVAQLPGPVAVAYEAGPTGFGLARAFAAVGVRCEVVAPSKLQRPPGGQPAAIARRGRSIGLSGLFASDLACDLVQCVPDGVSDDRPGRALSRRVGSVQQPLRALR